jgi:pimeloyl-ACP methyl ester carboxylesterase
MQAIVDSLLTNYEQTGSGKTVLLLHGWGDDLTTFKNLQKSLSSSYRVVAVDLPGFGKSEAPHKTWSLSDYSNFVKDFLIKINAQPTFAIIGHSNGGALSIKALANGDLEASKLILMAASGIRNKDKTKKLIIKGIAKTGKAATFWLPDNSKKKLQKKLYGVVGSDMLVAPHLQETFKRTVAEDVQADAAKLNLLALLIYAQNDKAVPVEYGRIYAGLIKNSKLVVVAAAQHFVHHDQPVQVETLIKEFLDA